MFDLESACVELVANSGEAKSYIMDSLREAREGNYKESASFLEKADNFLLLAHKVQTDLIHREGCGELQKEALGILLIHAQDHLMTTLLAKDLAFELIEIYKKLK